MKQLHHCTHTHTHCYFPSMLIQPAFVDQNDKSFQFRTIRTARFVLTLLPQTMMEPNDEAEMSNDGTATENDAEDSAGHAMTLRSGIFVSLFLLVTLFS